MSDAASAPDYMPEEIALDMRGTNAMFDEMLAVWTSHMGKGHMTRWGAIGTVWMLLAHITRAEGDRQGAEDDEE